MNRPHPDEDRVPEYTATFTLDRLIEEAKREIGPERWAELNAEWESE